jgi:hypothetical protein
VTGLDENHSTLAGLVVSGGLVWGRIVPADIAGFPELRELQVVRAWRPASARPPTGVFRRLVDNRIRCVKAPCYSISAGALNTARGRTVSGVDLRRAGASAEERRWAIDLIERPGLIATGRIVRASDGGRTFVASQIYLPAR